MKRLVLARGDEAIQGYSDQVFWERNTLKGATGPRRGRRRTTTTPGDHEQASILE